jgi:hypothetical protein
VELLLSDGVDAGGVLLLKDDDGVAHLQCPAVHHLGNAEVSVESISTVKIKLLRSSQDRQYFWQLLINF